MNEIFPVGRPALAEDVVDRNTFMDETAVRLADGQSVMIASPRRTGKSSVALEILRRLAKRDFLTAAVDLFYVASIEELAAKIFKAVVETETGPRRLAVHSLKTLREWLLSPEIHARLREFEVGVLLSHPTMEPLELLETALITAENLAARRDRRMIILLDEFQEIDRLGGELLEQRLRALLQQQRHTAYLFLGSHTTLMQTLFAGRGRALYRLATLSPLPPIPADAWKDYLTQRFVSVGLPLSSPAEHLILEKTGGHPAGVMALAYDAYLLGRIRDQAEISSDTIFEAYENTLTALSPIYNSLWAEIHRIRHGDLVLKAITNDVPPYSLSLAPHIVQRALKALTDSSVLYKGSARGDYRLVEPIFGDWIKRRG